MSGYVYQTVYLFVEWLIVRGNNNKSRESRKAVAIVYKLFISFPAICTKANMKLGYYVIANKG